MTTVIRSNQTVFAATDCESVSLGVWVTIMRGTHTQNYYDFIFLLYYNWKVNNLFNFFYNGGPRQIRTADECFRRALHCPLCYRAMVMQARLELAVYGLKVRCITNYATASLAAIFIAVFSLVHLSLKKVKSMRFVSTFKVLNQHITRKIF